MNIELKNIKNFTENKKIALFTVTKDLIHFINLYRKYQSNFEIVAVVDITLGYRPTIKAKIESVIGNIPLITTLSGFSNIASNVDLIIKFDHAIVDDRLHDEMEQYDGSEFNIPDFEEKIRRTYNYYIDVEEGNEFTFNMLPRQLSFLNSWLITTFDCYIMHCYGDKLLVTYNLDSSLTEEEQLVIVENRALTFSYDLMDFTFENRSINIHKLRVKKTIEQKPIFVLSSDFAGGKMSYILKKSNDNYLTRDLFIAFFDVEKYFGNGGLLDRNSIASTVYKALSRREHFFGHEESVFIKIEGNLGGFLFPFEIGNSTLTTWGNLHHYFNNYEFHIIIKEDEDIEKLKKQLDLFKHIYKVENEKIKIIKSINHCERFEEVILN